MTDRLLAIASLAALALFTGVVVVFVKEIDLMLVVLLCLMMGVYDFWTTFRKQAKGGDGKR